MDSGDYTEDFMYNKAYEEIDGAVVQRLSNCKYYQKWLKECDELAKKHPILKKFFLNGRSAVSLSEEEHEAFVRYAELQDQMVMAQKQESYYVGQIHADILRSDLDKRKCDAARYPCNGFSMQEDLFVMDVRNKEDEQKLLRDFFIILGKERERNLKNYPKYQKLRKKEKKLLRNHPFIQRLMEGNHTGEELKLSCEQQQALLDFFALQKRKRTFETLETLLIGGRACRGK